MREIKEIAAFIDDEVEGALEYAKAAAFYKDTRPALASIYMQLATTEYGHVTKLHTEAAKLVKEAETKGVEYPQAMKDKWDEMHKASIAKMAEAKTYMGLGK